ncbi:MAG: DNA starvation/stationary phase protection protein [Clostridiales bacterium]|nr:DNA starvation/stationary phase protection protein [Clostridiales bacterium]
MENTKRILNQSVADLYVAHIAIHQIHWYMRGEGFMVWHPKMDEYIETLDEYVDEISERLITLGGTPYSTLKEFLENTKIEEVKGEFKNVPNSLERVIEIFRYLVSLFEEGLKVTDEDGDDVSNGIFADAKGNLEKTIWMLTAELGQEPKL